MDCHTFSNSHCQWLHVLLRGHAGESGQDQLDEYVREFAEKSLDAMHLPILEFRYKNLEALKVLLNSLGQNTNEDTGLIVTSPRVVEAIRRSLDQQELSTLSKSLNPELLFAVGPRTAEECDKKLNLRSNRNSSASSNSADLAKIIKSTCETRHRPIRLVYPKSSLADKTIENALAGHVCTDVIIAYETKPVEDLGNILSDAIGRHLASAYCECVEFVHINLIFFSPSGVEGYSSMLDQELFIANVIRRVGKAKKPIQVALKHSCIGRTTEAALKHSNLDVLCVADKPNARSLADVVARSCEP